MPEKATGYEPVDITSDANSLTRSASRMLYHTEKLWPLIRVGMLSKAISERDYHVNQVFLKEKLIPSKLKVKGIAS